MRLMSYLWPSELLVAQQRNVTSQKKNFEFSTISGIFGGVWELVCVIEARIKWTLKETGPKNEDVRNFCFFAPTQFLHFSASMQIFEPLQYYICSRATFSRSLHFFYCFSLFHALFLKTGAKIIRLHAWFYGMCCFLRRRKMTRFRRHGKFRYRA